MKKVCFRLGLAVIFLFCAHTTEAATLYMSPNETEMHPGDTITVGLRIDTDEGECINVVDGVIEYSPIITPVDISRGESILPIWVEEPTIDTGQNRITFAGGIPNGYCGRIDGDPGLTNLILELVFQAPGFVIGIGERDNTAKITYGDQTRVLLNDGTGAEAPLGLLGANIFVYDEPGPSVVNEWSDRVDADTTPPNEFSISLERDEFAFGGRYFIVFNTTDKQSGMDHYEVIEEPISALDVFGFGAANAPWVEAKSPYLLEDQSLNSTIRVKAIDKAGNEYIATLVPDESLRTERPRLNTGTTSSYFYVIAGIVVLLLVFGGAYIVYRKYAKPNYGPMEDNTDPELPEDSEE